ncbi:MAG: hypothetical protein RJA10_698 [Pseudomonadota bacterium]
MGNKEVSAALWKKLKPLVPQPPPRSAKGGRPRVDDQRALSGILFVLRTGIAWEDLPQELGYGSGMTCWRRRTYSPPLLDKPTQPVNPLKPA